MESFVDICFKAGYDLEKNKGTEKVAGYTSEVLSAALNPVYAPFNAIGALYGHLASGGKERKKVIDEDEMWANILIPGLAGYRLGSRNRAAMTDD
jgi:hypothetical protein